MIVLGLFGRICLYCILIKYVIVLLSCYIFEVIKDFDIIEYEDKSVIGYIIFILVIGDILVLLVYKCEWDFKIGLGMVEFYFSGVLVNFVVVNLLLV